MKGIKFLDTLQLVLHMPYNTNRSSQNASELLADNVIRIRKARNISQSDIGRLSNVSQRTVSKLEKKGEGGVANLDTVEALAEFFKTPLWLLLLDGMPVDPGEQKALDDAVKAILSLSQENRKKVYDRISELLLVESASRHQQFL